MQSRKARYLWAMLLALGWVLASPAGSPAQPPIKDVRGSASPRLDCFGDPLPSGAVARCGTIRFCPGSPSNNLAFSSNGKVLATTSAWETISFWDPITGKEIQRLKRTDDITIMRSADCHAFVGVRQNDLLVWDLKTNAEPRKLNGQVHAISTIAFSSDGKYVAMRDSSRPQSPLVGELRADATQTKTDWRLRIWDIATGKETYQVNNLTPEPTCMGFVGNAGLLALACKDSTIRIVDTKAGKE
jgi:WD40 repeat protein